MQNRSALALFWSLLVLQSVGFVAGSPVSHAQADADEVLSPARQLAELYGLSAWSNVEQIDFTFRVELPDGRVIERPWSWRPQDKTVTARFGTPDAKTFSLDAIDDASRDAHARFINDSYWLLFPFQLVWSTCEVTGDGEAEMPISGDPSRKLTVTYPGEGGYTPGDVYELFLDPETGLIAEWNFRKGGGENGRPARWLNRQELLGVFHHDSFVGPPGSGFRLMFPHVRVETGDGRFAETNFNVASFRSPEDF